MTLKVLPLKTKNTPIRNTREWLENAECVIVDNPEIADFIIFEDHGDPITEIMSAKKRFEEFAQKLVFILSGDADTSDDKSLWFCSSVVPNKSNKFQIYTYNSRIHTTKPESKHKTIKGNFCGTIWNTPERRCLTTLSSDWLIKESHWWNLDAESKANLSYYTYDLMKSSYYTLCPKGKGSSSMRVAESLACGSIPILIADESDPFYENYGNLAVRIYRKDMQNINKILDKLPIPNESQIEQCIYFYEKQICRYNKLPWTVCSGFSNKIISALKKQYEYSSNRGQ
jgi:hypothetical protein